VFISLLQPHEQCTSLSNQSINYSINGTTMEKYILKENIEKELQHNADWARAQFPSYESVMTLQSGHRLSILSTSVKTKKGEDYDIAIMYLAPHRTVKGINNCLFAGICAGTCLDRTGKMPFHAERRTRLTLALYLYPIKFITELLMELSFAGFKSYQKNKKRWIRLNGTSDIRWEREDFEDVSGRHYMNIMQRFPDVIFYDYTKDANRTDLPANYDLTFSYSGVPEFQPYVEKALDKGMRMAVVWRSVAKIPQMFKGIQVVNGDNSDVRDMDEQGVIVGLYAKGKAKRDTSGFVVG